MKPTYLEKRKFYRHPISIPIQYHETLSKKYDRCSTVDLSEGGLAFHTDRFLVRGALVYLKIPVGDQVFEISGQVAYCNRVPSLDLFRTGVAFQDTASAFRAKLAEQMLRIKKYQKKISEERGRDIPEDEAAREWIEKFAQPFSHLF